MNDQKITITRQQFLKLQEIFSNSVIEEIVLHQSHNNGIGPAVTVEYQVSKDITDYDKW